MDHMSDRLVPLCSVTQRHKHQRDGRDGQECTRHRWEHQEDPAAHKTQQQKLPSPRGYDPPDCLPRKPALRAANALLYSSLRLQSPQWHSSTKRQGIWWHQMKKRARVGNLTTTSRRATWQPTQLKALAKASSTRTFRGEELFLCIAFFAPFTATPTCKRNSDEPLPAPKPSSTFSSGGVATHPPQWDAPTPEGLGSATRPAPSSPGAMVVGAMPSDTKLTTAASCVKRASVAPATQASRKCWTRSPVGPGVFSAGKARKQGVTTPTQVQFLAPKEGLAKEWQLAASYGGARLPGAWQSQGWRGTSLQIAGQYMPSCQTLLCPNWWPGLAVPLGTTAQGGEGAGDGSPTNSCVPRQATSADDQGYRPPQPGGIFAHHEAAQHRLRHNQELRPRARIIAVGNCCQSTGQGLLPGMPGKAWHMRNTEPHTKLSHTSCLLHAGTTRWHGS